MKVLVSFLLTMFLMGLNFEVKAQDLKPLSEVKTEIFSKKIEDLKLVHESLKFQPLMVWNINIPKPVKQIRKFKVPLPGFLGRGQELLDRLTNFRGDGYVISGSLKYNPRNGNVKFKTTFTAEPRVFLGFGKKVASIFK